MKENTTYKVLWVDDEEEVVSAFVMASQLAGFEVTQFLSWDKAAAELKQHFFDWDAVILDVHCVVKEGEPATDYFLSTAVTELVEIGRSKGAEIPWYILSAGPGRISDFDPVVTMAKGMSDRERHNKEWGQMVYLKIPENLTKGYQDLYDSIAMAVANVGDIVSRTHRSLRSAMEVLRLTQQSQLHNILLALYDNENRHQFDPKRFRATLRMTVEDLFHRAHEIGMVPDDFYVEGKLRDISGTSRFLAGRNTGPELNARLEKPFLPEWVANVLQGVIHFDSESVHSGEGSERALAVQSFFGYTLLMVDVLEWFAEVYRRQKDDPEAVAQNRSLRLETTPPQEVVGKYKGKTFVVQETEGCHHVDNCLVLESIPEGTKVKVNDVVLNQADTRSRYPYFLKVQLVKK